MEADPLQEDLLCRELKRPGCSSPGSTEGQQHQEQWVRVWGCRSCQILPARAARACSAATQAEESVPAADGDSSSTHNC